MMLRAIVLLGFAAIALGASLNGRIVGGDDADIEDFPYIVSLRYMDVHICGGAILNENTILTAAHCLEGMSDYLTVRVGNRNNKKGDRYGVQAFIPHIDYNTKTVDNDICILKLGSNIKFKPTVQPIQMIDMGKEVLAGTKAVVSGWGDEFEGANKTATYLKMVELDVISDDDCKKLFGSDRITQNMMCTQTAGKDACKGDSGGPLVQGGKLVGVVSWSIGCARPEYAGIYTKVSKFHDWAKSYM